MRQARRWLPVLAAALLLSACASKPPPAPRTTVTLLPQADGTPSAVTVRPLEGGESAQQWLDKPYQSAEVRRGQPTGVRSGDAAQVEQAYAPLFATAPLPPAKFVLYFRPGGTQLTTESQREMGRILQEAERYSGAEIVLIGHTDTTSTAESNDTLSLRRAELVRGLFVQRGFPPQRLQASGRGERDLAVPTRDGVEEIRNRRVEILVR